MVEGGTGYHDMETTNKLIRNRIVGVVEEDGMKNSFCPLSFALLEERSRLKKGRLHP